MLEFEHTINDGVMRGLDPRIQTNGYSLNETHAWIAGSSPAMTLQ
jgi:hypothetical protein